MIYKTLGTMQRALNGLLFKWICLSKGAYFKST
jgi:hypothetical protein